MMDASPTAAPLENPSPGPLETWRMFLWLRWRLTRNQWRKKGGWSEAASILILTVLAGGVIVAIVMGFLLGAKLLAGSSPATLALAMHAIALGFLMFWLTGLLVEIQRSQAIDLAKLIYLPIPLGQLFLFNFLASWFTPSLLIFVPGSVAFVLGLAWSKGLLLLALLPVVLGFFVMVSGATYLLRGWLVSLMVDKRKGRTVIMAASIVLIVVAQLPNLYFQLNRPVPQAAKSAPAPALKAMGALERYVPVLWPGYAARTLAGGQLASALAVAVGGVAIGGLSVIGAYRNTLNFYRGRRKEKRLHTPAPAPSANPPGRLLERSLPGLSSEASAIALAELQSYLRAPEVKFAIVSQLIISVLIGVMLYRSQGLATLAGYQPFLGTGIVLLSLLSVSQLLFNQFGFNRDGFRAYVLSPAKRKDIWMGKNAAMAVFLLLPSSLLLLVAAGMGYLKALVLLAALLKLLAGLCLFTIIGNWFSALNPYHIAPGSLKPTKQSAGAIFLVLAGMVIVFVLAAIFLLPPLAEKFAPVFRWLPGWPIDLLGSAVLAGLALVAYGLSLGPLARLLQRREQIILSAVTSEIE